MASILVFGLSLLAFRDFFVLYVRTLRALPSPAIGSVERGAST